MVRRVEHPVGRSIRPKGHQGENWKVVYAVAKQTGVDGIGCGSTAYLSFHIGNEQVLKDIGDMIVGSSYLFHHSAGSVQPNLSWRRRYYTC